MGLSLPDSIDPQRFAEERARCQGRVALAGLARLQDTWPDQQGEAQVSLAGTVDHEGWRILDLTVAATLTGRCERCLQPLAVPLATTSRLAVVASEDLIGRLPEAYDPLLVATAETRIRVADLVEDEILLALPMIPCHEGQACPEALVPSAVEIWEGPRVEEQDPDGGRRENPFAALAQWRKPPTE
jgi:uncharacterized protein